MIHELEVKGLDAYLEDEDIFSEFEQMLHSIFEDLDVIMPKIIVTLIHQYCQPGTTYIHTRDGGEFPINLGALGLSKLLSNLVELRPFEPIHLPKCPESNIFSLVIKYLDHHNGVEPAEIPKPIRSIHLSSSVEDEWDVEFADSLGKKEIFQVILHANYIDCPSLISLMCAKVATMIKGKSPAEIKDILSESDNEPEEVVNLKRVCMCGYKWESTEESEQAEVMEEEVMEDPPVEQELTAAMLDDGLSLDMDIDLEEEVNLDEPF